MDRTYRRRRSTIAAAALASLLSIPLHAGAQDHAPTGLQPEVRFDRSSPLSTNDELLRRLLTPLQAEITRRKLAAANKTLSVQPVDVSAERFTLYAPAKAPPGGYGLLVFVPPWPEAKIPPEWMPVLDRYGVIFVTAARSGNDASVLGRRIPLAVIAAQNVIGRYPVDPQRVYVGGLSGGSRVALRTAIAFPDLFHGAFLNAGSDPLGGEDTAVPPRALLYAFQAQSRLVAATGSDDAINIAKDAETAQSMARWCQFNFTPRSIPFAGHQLADAQALSEALDLFRSPAPANPARLTACRSALDGALARAVQGVQANIAAGRTGDARKAILALDQRFGGLADDRLVKLAMDCGCGVLP